MTETTLFFLYGGVAIVAVFMFFSCGRLAWREARQRDWNFGQLRQNTYFAIVMSLVFHSIGLFGVGVLRVVNSVDGMPLGGTWPMLLTLSMGAIFAAMLGFHWATAPGRARPLWWIMLGSIGLWGLVVFL